MDAVRRFSKPSIFNRNEKPFSFSHNHPKVDSCLPDEPQDMDVDVIDVELNKIEPERSGWPVFPAENHPVAKRSISRSSKSNTDWSDDTAQVPNHMNLLSAAEAKTVQQFAAKTISNSLDVMTDEETTLIPKEVPGCKKKAFPAKMAFGFSKIFRKNNKGDTPTYVPPLAGASKGIFGCKLEEIPETAMTEWDKAKIPKICGHMAKYLLDNKAEHKEGIFRLGGAFHRIQSIVTDVVAGVYDNGFDSLNGKFIENGGCVSSVPFQPNMETPIHEVASVLKKFLRELAEPIIPNRLHAAGKAIVILHANSATPSDTTIKHVRNVILLLPSRSRNLLQFTLDLATLVARNQQNNQMNAENLGRVLGPNLITYTPVLQIADRSNQTAGLDAFNWINKFFEICVIANGQIVPELCCGKEKCIWPSATSPLFHLDEEIKKTIRQTGMTTGYQQPVVDNNRGLQLCPPNNTQPFNIGFSRPPSGQTGFFFTPNALRTFGGQDNAANKKRRCH